MYSTRFVLRNSYSEILNILRILNKKRTLYSIQFGFQTGHSSDHTIVHFTDQILESFDNNEFTIDFIDLSKAFDTLTTKNY